MALTLAKFIISNRCNKFSSLHYFKNVVNKNATLPCSSISSRNYSIEPQIDKYIPLSSRTLFKRLMEENEKADASKDFEKFASEAENTISKQNINVMPELKFLYSPLDPDTPSPGDLSLHEVQDRHFWFMHHLTSLLSSAGFEELERAKEKLKEGVVSGGVLVDCNMKRFDIFKIFVLGGQNDPHTTTTSTKQFFSTDKLFNKGLWWRRPKRVVVVRRDVGASKVDVRMFKGITSPSLLIPPTGSLRMHPTYKNILLTSSTLSLFFFLSRPSLHWLLGTDPFGNTPLTLSAFFGAASGLMWVAFKQAQKHHLERVVDVMFEGVVARRMQCLQQLVKKSQEELFKGVLLSYHFLNVNNKKTAENEGLSVCELETQVDEWVKGECGGVVVKVALEETIKWMIQTNLLVHNDTTNKLILSPSSHHSTITDLFHNTLSDTTTQTPISTTIMQNIRKIKGTA